VKRVNKFQINLTKISQFRFSQVMKIQINLLRMTLIKRLLKFQFNLVNRAINIQVYLILIPVLMRMNFKIHMIRVPKVDDPIYLFIKPLYDSYQQAFGSKWQASTFVLKSKDILFTVIRSFNVRIITEPAGDALFCPIILAMYVSSPLSRFLARSREVYHFKLFPRFWMPDLLLFWKWIRSRFLLPIRGGLGNQLQAQEYLLQTCQPLS